MNTLFNKLNFHTLKERIFALFGVISTRCTAEKTERSKKPRRILGETWRCLCATWRNPTCYTAEKTERGKGPQRILSTT